MAKNKCPECKPGLPGWLATYGDLVTLLLCFFVLLFAMSTTDAAKYQAAFSYFADNIDILPGGTTLTEGELISDGVSQLSALEEIFTEQINFARKEGDNGDKTTLEDSSSSTTSSAIVTEQVEVNKEIAAAINQELINQGIIENVAIEYNAQVIKLRIAGEVLFDSGQADIRSDANYIIKAIGQIIASSTFDDKTIQIEGHTDNVPMSSIQFPSNWELSNARAAAVGKFLITEYNIDPARLVAAGYGEYRPIASNDTQEGRAKNRRVEIKLIGKEVTLSDEYTKLEE